MQRSHALTLVAAIGIVTLLGVGALTAFSTVGAEGEDPETEGNHTIDVTATGEAEAAPDSAVVEVAVTAEGDDIDAVHDELTTGTDDLTDGLDGLGVDYETDSFDVSSTFRDERPEYDGVHGFTVTLDEPDRAGAVIDVAADAGAEVRNVGMTMSEELQSDLRDQALDDAMADAQHQAESIADNAGLTLTTPEHVDATGSSFVPLTYAAELEVATDESVDIEAGDVSVTYDVTVVYNAAP